MVVGVGVGLTVGVDLRISLGRTRGVGVGAEPKVHPTSRAMTTMLRKANSLFNRDILLIPLHATVKPSNGLPLGDYLTHHTRLSRVMHPCLQEIGPGRCAFGSGHKSKKVSIMLYSVH